MEAETEADRIPGEIRAGTFGKGVPVLSTLTLRQLGVCLRQRDRPADDLDQTVLAAGGPGRAEVTVEHRKGSPHLTPECQQALRAINLHFHDLRREAGSRGPDGRVPLQVVRDWLGHTNVAQTSTYLASTTRTREDAVRRYERRLQEFAGRPATEGQEPPRSAELATKDPKRTAVVRSQPQIR